MGTFEAICHTVLAVLIVTTMLNAGQVLLAVIGGSPSQPRPTPSSPSQRSATACRYWSATS